MAFNVMAFQISKEQIDLYDKLKQKSRLLYKQISYMDSICELINNTPRHSISLQTVFFIIKENFGDRKQN